MFCSFFLTVIHEGAPWPLEVIASTSSSVASYLFGLYLMAGDIIGAIIGMFLI